MAGSTFSYAQAAKGLSTPVAASKPISGAATPAKETISAHANGPVTSALSWAEEADSESQVDQPIPSPEATSKESLSKPTPPTPSVETPDISSPDLGASSASTVTKDDDVQSLPNGSSDSTWDNKSQASTSVANSLESGDKTSEKGKKGKNAVKIEFQEAPLPAVNIWKKRAEEQNAKAPKSTTAPLANGATHGNSALPPRRSDSGLKARPTTSDSRTKGHDDSRLPQNRRDSRAEPESRKDTKGKTSEKDSKQTLSTLPPPPARDQESWPTPEIAIDEDRKKIHEKSEKGEKDRKDNTLSGTQGKHEWVKVPYTPSVVFNTPLPNAANTRRGGRPGGRGAAQTNGRASGSAASGAGHPEKDGSAPAAVSNGDQSRRERVEGGAPHDALSKSKRTVSASSLPSTDQMPASPTEKLSKAAASEVESRSRGGSSATESAQPPNQNGTFGRQYPNRSNKPRRGEFSGGGERRKEGESSPTKDKTLDDRRMSAAAHVDASEDVERRASAYNEGANGYHHKQGRYGSYSGGRERDRGRGGARGGRGSYTNGHQYTNGHMPLQPQSTAFSMGPRSPPTFYPENPSYFTPPQSKFSPYQGGPQIAPLQTYSMYDYNMMQQPMSAVPYTPYVDQSGLCAMLTTQLEYYFSLDNLLKDMYLRRQMDSQGFVPLDFIAGFNRIKNLSTDIELVKLVCQQSSVVEYRTGEDGRDRLRRKDNWQQWVLNMDARDEVARNEGPKELHNPPVPHPTGFDQTQPPRWPMSATASVAPYGTDHSFPRLNGHEDTASTTETPLNDTTSDGSGDGAVPNGQSVERTTMAYWPRTL